MTFFNVYCSDHAITGRNFETRQEANEYFDYAMRTMQEDNYCELTKVNSVNGLCKSLKYQQK